MLVFVLGPAGPCLGTAAAPLLYGAAIRSTDMARKTRQGKTTLPTHRRAQKRLTKPSTAQEEIAVLQEILALHGGQLENFNPTPPPTAVKIFLRKATLSQLQGTLVELLAALRKAKR